MIHFTTEKDQSWNQEKGMSTTIPAKDEWVEMFFDTTKNVNWTGTIDCIRFDLIDAEGIYDIKKIVVEGKAGSKNDVVVDGVALDEPYINEPPRDKEDFFAPVTVPEGYVFVMGDNRNESLDSRRESVGAIHKDDLMGKVVLRLYPFSEFGLID